MSITIKHLSGPLTGETVFDDSTNTILVGRAPSAQIVYPEECIEVDGEHVKLVRDPASGGYTIELVGSCDVELDGKTAETGMEIIPGSVITVGLGGPRFACFPSGVMVKHIDGPLAGQQQYFPSGVEVITFGRPPDKTDVSYPGDYTKVGRTHFSLKKNNLGGLLRRTRPQALRRDRWRAGQEPGSGQIRKQISTRRSKRPDLRVSDRSGGQAGPRHRA